MRAMVENLKRIILIQTAFIGDAVLSLPLVQVLKRFHPEAELDVVAVPRSASLFRNHPDLSRVIEYDKRGKDKGVRGFARLVRQLRKNSYDLAIVPHRSIRSALLAALAGIPARIGFDVSAGWFLFTTTVKYRKDIHEIERNLSLLEGLGKTFSGRELPALFPSTGDVEAINEFLRQANLSERDGMIAIAPGTIWNTKRWLKEGFAEVARKLAQRGHPVVLVGGREDDELCSEISTSVKSEKVVSAAGKLTLLESAELVRRCKVLISNDSAPMHIAVAMKTPVVAIFGATVAEFGFAPYGPKDIVVETPGLTCRPCSIHGGNKCPIETFECMRNISPEKVLREAERFITNSKD
jgi:heptosyltransferase-2